MDSAFASRFLQNLSRYTGKTTFDRGNTYARMGRVTGYREDAEMNGLVVSGIVRGSYAYSTNFTITPNGAIMDSSCSCPVTEACKHVAALGIVWAQKQSTTPQLLTLTPHTPRWEEPFAALIRKNDHGKNAEKTLQLQLLFHITQEKRDANNTGPFILTLRPVVYNTNTDERSLSTIQWKDFYYRDTSQKYPVQQWRFCHLVSLALLGHHGYGTSGWHVLHHDEAGALWPLLKHAIDYDVDLLFGPKKAAPLSIITNPPLSQKICLRAHANGLDVRMEWRVEEHILPNDVPVLCGNPPVFAFLSPVNERGETSYELREIRGASAHQLGDAPLIIPKSGIHKFTSDYLPMIIDQGLQVENLAPSLVLPEKGTPKMGITIQAAGSLTITIDAAYRYGDAIIAFDDNTTPLTIDKRSIIRDQQMESLLYRQLSAYYIHTPSAWTQDPFQPIKSSLTCSGMEAASIVQTLLPQLQKDPSFIVTIIGDLPPFTDLMGDPVITMSTGESDQPDWFDLSLTVHVDDAEIPIAVLIEALAHGETHLLLKDGGIVSLAHPQFEKLKQLLEEARGMVEITKTGVRLSRFQAGYWEEFAALGIMEKQAKSWSQSVGTLLKAESIPEPDTPAETVKILRPYQQEGVDWLLFLASRQLGGILADDMGLGKTLQAITMLLALHPAKRTRKHMPSLVIAPTSVVESWAHELERFAPRLKTVFMRAGDRTDALKHLEKVDLIVTSYGLFLRDIAAYEAMQFQCLIIDEAQYIKNHQSKTYGCIRRVNARCRFALTGTPLENSTLELWAIHSVVTPGLFGDPKWFREHYQFPIEREGDSTTLARLRQRIRPFMLRRTKELVAKELPPKIEQTLFLELPPPQRRLYDLHLQRERQKVLKLLSEEGGMQKHRFTIFRSLMRLRQLCLHPALIDDDHASCPSAKLEMLAEHLETILSEKHKVLVFSQFTSFLAHVKKLLDDKAIPYLSLDGRTKNRGDLVKTFQSDNGPSVFLISLKAGGVGLTLTAADYCILLDPWWNPAVERQAVDRTHRIGQKKHVFVYRFIAKNTIEEKVLALQEKKKRLFQNVLNDGEAFVSLLSEKEIVGLLALGE